MKTQETQKPVYALHHEHQGWINHLNFFEDELKVMRHRLEEIVSANNKQDILKMVEHFQNQGIIQKNEIDNLKHTVRMAEQELLAFIEQNPQVADKRKKEDEVAIRRQVDSFEKLFTELRQEFNAFAGKVL
jgi:hypothetical protein